MDNSINICHVENLLWTSREDEAQMREKACSILLPPQYHHYLPLRKSIRRYKRRSVDFSYPMFSGYVFCLLDQ